MKIGWIESKISCFSEDDFSTILSFFVCLNLLLLPCGDHFQSFIGSFTLGGLNSQ
jgi:hypothetical protein